MMKETRMVWVSWHVGFHFHNARLNCIQLHHVRLKREIKAWRVDSSISEPRVSACWGVVESPEPQPQPFPQTQTRPGPSRFTRHIGAPYHMLHLKFKTGSFWDWERNGTRQDHTRPSKLLPRKFVVTPSLVQMCYVLVSRLGNTAQDVRSSLFPKWPCGKPGEWGRKLRPGLTVPELIIIYLDTNNTVHHGYDMT